MTASPHTPCYPSVDATSLPWLTIEQMAEADRLAVEEFGIELLQMMEHAGAVLATELAAWASAHRALCLDLIGHTDGSVMQMDPARSERTE